jgi:uncharacterized protein YndB with AHSA1/START domain
MESENVSGGQRIDTASRVILAPPRTLFRAFLDAESLANWRAPDGMTASILRFDPRIGGGYRMILGYDEGETDAVGKTRAGEDEVVVQFLELLPHERIVEAIRFVSDDPAFAGVMILTTSFEPTREGTKVSFRASEVPAGIDREEHLAGMASSLRNLARLTE